MHWMCAWTPSLFSPIYALQGDTGWVFQGDCLGLVTDLQVRGTLYVIFSFSVAPYTIHSPPSFYSRLHNHCTAHKGLSSQVQPRLARIKECFQLKMFFPLFFFFPQPAPSLPFLVFSFLVSCGFFYYSCLLWLFTNKGLLKLAHCLLIHISIFFSFQA